MGIFDKFNKKSTSSVVAEPKQGEMAEMALNSIADGVIMIDGNGAIRFINPAAMTMVGCAHANEAIGANYLSLIRLETGEGMSVADEQNPFVQAVGQNVAFESRGFVLVTVQGKKTPVALNLTPSGRGEKVITLRNITKELEEEGEQTEFISTASHEMRTPVASIEGYLGLALNPATATIDERARQYLTEAHNASQHLGRLFRDLLDVTNLDDKRVKVHVVPVEMTEVVKTIADAHIPAMGKKKLRYSFGTVDEMGDSRITVDQLNYASVDVDFLREALDNIIENAIKYTKEGGAIYVNVRGDGDRVLINVTDTGMGIAPDDLTHIFQKFYRVDNSQTRTIGGTGLGLYIVKQRVEALGGRVWAESEFGEGSTFYISLPRLTPAEYERQRQIAANIAAMAGGGAVSGANSVAAPAAAPSTTASAAGVATENFNSATRPAGPSPRAVGAAAPAAVPVSAGDGEALSRETLPSLPSSRGSVGLWPSASQGAVAFALPVGQADSLRETSPSPAPTPTSGVAPAAQPVQQMRQNDPVQNMQNGVNLS